MTKRESKIYLFSASLVLLLSSSAKAAAPDADGDTVQDILDNCINIANLDQRDSNADGFGNACDADLNDDSFVNTLDLGVFRAAFNTSNANSDLNGDGKVNSLDLGLFRGLFLRPPGPSSVLLRDDLAADPPTSQKASYGVLGQTMPDGSNATASFDFGGDDFGNTLAIALDRAVQFNDIAIAPDVTAGDGIYSGFVKLDLADLQNTETQYRQRLSAIPNPKVLDYSGRDVTSQGPPSTPGGLSASSLALSTPAAGPFGIPDTFLNPAILVSTVDPERSLMIRDRAVVSDVTRTFDPCDTNNDGAQGNVNGAWSFKTLMTNMANTPLTGVSAQQFVHDWARNWLAAQTVNSFSIPPKPNLRNFFPGWDGVNVSTLDMNRLPFRLLAIVNRQDLAGGALYGTPPDPKKAETRFVFGLVDQSNSACNSPNPLDNPLGASRPMTVIFEYGDPTATCGDVTTRARAWINLSANPVGTPAYNTALQVLTDGVTLAGAAPLKPNGSALDQLRTNEIALGSGPLVGPPGQWQLREFGLNAPFSGLVSATIKQTPQPSTFPPDTPLFRSSSATTQAYMEEFADDILCEQHVVPLGYPTATPAPFLGAYSNYGVGTIWVGVDPTLISGLFPLCWKTNIASGTQPTKGDEVRHKLSLNTCDDCHSGETRTFFTHVDPQSLPANLSGFLTGITVTDPTGATQSRFYNDLARRGQCLEDRARGCLKGPVAAANRLCAGLQGAH